MIVANRAIGASTKGKEEVEAKRNPYSKGFLGSKLCYLDEPTVACYEAAAHSRYGGCTNTTEGPSTCGFWDTWLDARTPWSPGFS
ncbi:hypothetical protein JTB14_020920 [Gonioctena quinquepunctata]|nr:hypothetical protein JTB14_020920 [Gonioctena quinquepunctata]